MRKLAAVLTILTIVTFLATGAVYAQDAPGADDISAIFLAQYDAINAGDLEGSLQYVSDDTVGIALPPPPDTMPYTIGVEGYQGLNGYLIGNHAEFEFTDLQVTGNTITFRALLTEDFFRAVGIYPIEFTGSAVVEYGRLVSETWIMNEQDDARLTAAVTQMNNKAGLMRAYEEVINQGNFDVLDQDIAPNAIDHSFPDLQGVDAFKIPLMSLREAFPDLQASVDMMIAEGDLVMALATFTGTHEGKFLGVPPSGQQITWSHIDINRFENGQVVEAWHIGTPGAILEAMGYQLTPPSE